MQQCSTKVLASYRLREQVSGAVRHRRNAASKSAGQLEKKLAFIATADLPAKLFSRFPAKLRGRSRAPGRRRSGRRCCRVHSCLKINYQETLVLDDYAILVHQVLP
jgi:hypothetical protein